MDWTEEIARKIVIKNRASEIVNYQIDKSVEQLIEALKAKQIPCDVEIRGNKISIDGECTMDFTEDTISKLLGTTVEKLTEPDIKDVIHARIALLFK